MAKKGKAVKITADVGMLLLIPEPKELRKEGVTKVTVRYARHSKMKWWHLTKIKTFDPETWCHFREGIYNNLFLKNLCAIYFT